MASFSISDAAFAGLRIVRERPKAFGLWLLLNLALGLAGAAAMTTMMGPSLGGFQSLGLSNPNVNPAAMMAMWRMLGPMLFVQFLFGVAYYSIAYAAIDRAVLRPSDPRFAYLRLGSDELRQLGLGLLMLVVGLGVYIGLIIVGVVVGVIAVIVGRGAPPALAGLLVVLAVLATFGGFLFIAVRLSLASAITFASRRVDLFSSWGVTRGRFWPMFATYLVAWLTTILIYLVGFAVIAAVTAAMGAGNVVNFMFHPDTRTIAALVTPARIIYLALNSVLTTLTLPMLIAPAATIYKSLSAPLGGVLGGEESIETIFS